MFENFKPTKDEKALIDGAYHTVHSFDPSGVEKCQNQEASGCGHKPDRIPATAARALCVKWFLKGVREPDTTLRDVYVLRPAAIYVTGLGASISARKIITQETIDKLHTAEQAYDAAFDRMIEARG